VRSITLTQRPITSWPWQETQWRKASPFRSSWSKTVDLLDREVYKRSSTDEAIIEIDVGARDIRRDGWIRSDARPRSPRVVLTFEDLHQGWLRYRCDRFLSWRDNVRAIALGMEALRRVDRYGITDGEQYHGFRSGRALPGKVLTSREAAALISENGDDPEDYLHDPEACRLGILRALKRNHPDHGGTADELYVVQAARDVLSQHHGVEV